MKKEVLELISHCQYKKNTSPNNYELYRDDAVRVFLEKFEKKQNELIEVVKELLPETEYALECAEMSDGEGEDSESIKEKITRAKQIISEVESEDKNVG